MLLCLLHLHAVRGYAALRASPLELRPARAKLRPASGAPSHGCRPGTSGTSGRSGLGAPDRAGVGPGRIANVLATYVRTHAAEPQEKGQAVPADVHASLTVLTTRNTAQDGAFRLDLRSVWLPDIEIGRSLNEDRASLAKANLSHANLRGTDLFNSDVREADLRGADLRKADLTFAQMHRTHLQGADLRGAKLFAADLRDAGLAEANLAGVFLRAADLPGASLPGASLPGASLSGADLSGADLSGVKNLTRKQLDSARIDGKTKCPAGLS